MRVRSIPTLPTYPDLPVIYPDEAVMLNRYGFMAMPPEVADTVHYPERLEMSAENLPHYHWRLNADKVVLNGLQNNAVKERIMLGLLPSTITHNNKSPSEYMTGVARYNARNCCDVGSGGAMVGGVVITRQNANSEYNKWANYYSQRPEFYNSTSFTRALSSRYKDTPANRLETFKMNYPLSQWAGNVYSSFMPNKDNYGIGSGMVGGTVSTQDGQRLINDRLQQRIIQLNALDASAWGSPTRQLSAVLPAPEPEDTYPIDSAMIVLADAVQTGAITGDLIDAVNKANSAIIQVGAILTDEQIAGLLQVNSNIYYSVLALLSDVTGTAGKFSLSAERKRILEAVKSGLLRQEKVLQLLNKNVYESTRDKQILLQQERGSLLKESSALLREKGAYGIKSIASRKVSQFPETASAVAENRRTQEAQRLLARQGLPQLEERLGRGRGGAKPPSYSREPPDSWRKSKEAWYKLTLTQQNSWKAMH